MRRIEVLLKPTVIAEDLVWNILVQVFFVVVIVGPIIYACDPFKTLLLCCISVVLVGVSRGKSF